MPLFVCLCVSLCVCQPACQTVSLPVWSVSLSIWPDPLRGDSSVHAIHTSQEETGKTIKAKQREVDVQTTVPELTLRGDTAGGMACQSRKCFGISHSMKCTNACQYCIVLSPPGGFQLSFWTLEEVLPGNK